MTDATRGAPAAGVTPAAVRRALRPGPVALAVVAARLAADPEAVRPVLAALKRLGHVRCVRRLWSLTGRGLLEGFP